MPSHTLRLILGDQLNPQHPWFDSVDDSVIYVLMEMRQETDYVLHHAQKILAIFAAMRDLARHMTEAGHRVVYLTIDDPANTQTLTGNLTALIAQHDIRHFDYQSPDEYRLAQQLQAFCASDACQISVSSYEVDSDHFYTQRHEAAALFAKRKQWLMEHFYRHMRLRHRVLIDGVDKPAGGQWNLDADNRRPWRGTPPEPSDARARWWPVLRPPTATVPHHWVLWKVSSGKYWAGANTCVAFTGRRCRGMTRTTRWAINCPCRPGSGPEKPACAAYIDRMSDYCKGCAYDKKQRLGEAACPFNALYWDFFDRHAERFERNPRIGMAYRQLEKMPQAERDAIRAQAQSLCARINDL